MNKSEYLKHKICRARKPNNKLDDIRNTIMVVIITKFPNHSEEFVEKATRLFDIEIGECVDFAILSNIQLNIADLLEKVSLCAASTMSETRLNFFKYE